MSEQIELNWSVHVCEIACSTYQAMTEASSKNKLIMI